MKLATVLCNNPIICKVYDSITQQSFWRQAINRMIDLAGPIPDGSQILDDLVPRHADAGVANRQRLGIRVDADVDLKLGVGIDDVLVGERPEANLVEGVGRVRHEFAQEHVLVGVE